MPSKIKKRGNGFLLTVVHEQKTYTKMSHATTKTAALSEWEDFKQVVKRGHVTTRLDGNIDLDSFYLYWQKHYAEINMEDSTQNVTKSVHARISAMLGHIPLSKINPQHILAFQKRLSAPNASVHNTPLSSAYIKRHLEVLKMMLDCAVDWGFISANPVDKIKMPQRKKSKKETPNEKTLSKFISLVDENENTKHRLWVSLAFAMGLRREEIFGLKWRDIDIPEQTMYIERAAIYIHGKGIVIKDTKTENSVRRVPIPDFICRLLWAWKAEVKETAQKRNKRKKIVDFADPLHLDAFVFTQPSGDVAHPHSFTGFLSKFCKQHNLPSISPHVLRHMYGSYLIANNVNIATVSSLMGHANKAFTLKTYIHEVQSLEHQTADIMGNTFSELKAVHKETPTMNIHSSKIVPYLVP
jgi:integrase